MYVPAMQRAALLQEIALPNGFFFNLTGAQ